MKPHRMLASNPEDEFRRLLGLWHYDRIDSKNMGYSAIDPASFNDVGDARFRKAPRRREGAPGIVSAGGVATRSRRTKTPDNDRANACLFFDMVMLWIRHNDPNIYNYLEVVSGLSERAAAKELRVSRNCWRELFAASIAHGTGVMLMFLDSASRQSARV